MIVIWPSEHSGQTCTYICMQFAISSDRLKLRLSYSHLEKVKLCACDLVNCDVRYDCAFSC